MIKKFFRFTAPVLIICFLGPVFAFSAQAAPEDYVCVVYFTGIGCLHCERVGSLVLEQLSREYPNLVIVEYEIYEQEQNALVYDEYVSTYHAEYGLPLMVFGQDNYLAGQLSIAKDVRGIIDELDSNKCPLIDGTAKDFNDLDPNSLPAYPTIWHQQKI